jgi:hypothetical protein
MQEREAGGGFNLQFIDRLSGETLSTEYTIEGDAEKAKDQAVDRARDLLANPPSPR